MAAARAPHGSNQPPKIIVKKIFVEGHGGHHGGAWKVAYADFVTAMMAFFLLLWILGATTEKQRKGIADYFAPTLLNTRSLGIGGSGMLGGETILSQSKVGPQVARTVVSAPIANGGIDFERGRGPTITPALKAQLNAQDQSNFRKLRAEVEARIKADPRTAALAKHIHFVQTRDGMRIDLVDDADYSMFSLGTTQLDGKADELLGVVADGIRSLPNPIMIRGHTDSLGYGDPVNMNNWMLSSGRAEATRRRLASGGIPEDRFNRIEGVADREPMIAADPRDARNRRVAITLLYRAGSFGE